MTTMLPLMESRPRMQRTHEVKSGEPATNVTIHTYAGNTRSMHKKVCISKDYLRGYRRSVADHTRPAP